MDNSNIKVYLGISVALVVLLILIIVIPFSKKPITNNQSPTTNLIIPTSVEINQSPTTNHQSPNTVPADSTGVAEEALPPAIVDAAVQKQDLRKQLPLTLTSFKIDFNYAEDKFNVTLNEPKVQSRNEFNLWKSNAYPGIEMSQFNFQ